MKSYKKKRLKNLLENQLILMRARNELRWVGPSWGEQRLAHLKKVANQWWW